MMLTLKDGVAPVRTVGGKAASLMKLYSTPGISEHVPGGVALTVDFFESWVDGVMADPSWSAAEPKLLSAEAPSVCEELKKIAKQLPFSLDQQAILQKLKTEIDSWPGRLAAVRSSAPEEDGTGASFAGVFETKLGVTVETVETAVRECFASVFDHRVFSYAGVHKPAFAAVVMEMVDSYTAGVAFSANPLNSDLDEMIVDSSWGLGESVVDGSIVADRIVWDKVKKKAIEKTIGSKKLERRLMTNGGVEQKPVDEKRQQKFTLSDQQITKLAELVSLVESTYEKPMDTEWAHTKKGELKLLQARPITTIYQLDDNMITPPGEPRVLYYDFNIASEATTTSPFTTMDLNNLSQMIPTMMGAPGATMWADNPTMLAFNGATRQYVNMSMVFRYVSPGRLASQMDGVNTYLSSIFRSKECNRSKYRAESLPKGVNCCSALRWMWQFPIWQLYKAKNKYESNPKSALLEHDEIWGKVLTELQAISKRGVTKGLDQFATELCDAFGPSMRDTMGAVNVVIPLLQKLDRARMELTNESEKNDAEALCGGYEGDELMACNIAMFNLARKLPENFWSEYKGQFSVLAQRIENNLCGKASDLPPDFLDAWKSFMENYGWDGPDQMFISSTRNEDNFELFLAKLSNSVGEHVKDPSISLHENATTRREVMKRQADAAAQGCFAGCRSWGSGIKHRNEILENLMQLRNAPKLHAARVVAMIRKEVLTIEKKLLSDNRLDEEGDIFHLSFKEVDQGMADSSFDLRQKVAPRKANYVRAKQSKVCPLLVDSRCRILKPDVIEGEPGTLVGAAISPGVATGRVRVVTSPTDHMETGEVLVALVTDPAWTPLFVGASGIVLQIGGALQHGALCAREYGKPAVSGIMLSELKTGMRVTVDGNTGIVKIHDDD